jgi:integrase
MELVPLPKQVAAKATNGKIEILSDDEVKRFVAAANSTYSNGKPIFSNAGIFLFMLNTGLRIGEAGALKWGDYDEANKTISVNSSIITSRDVDGKYIMVDQNSTKTRNSTRVLKLNSNAIEAIPKTRRSKYIFCTANDNPIWYRSIQYTLDRVCKRAGIPHKSTHVFRHTFASKLFEKGVDVRVVSELLGHTNVNTTYNTYIHLIQKQKAQAMEAIEDMY